ncbi:hypothetical protein GN244_ATG13471 [Phytophthora infestans]|uniref:PDZ domain-containing protein n=1 Tax=Phytophthora infestans TaxID=4787 RepID=A0A833W993_PHYIN|nr:hypothetical protein GN244_ATG13471 [Phytophthora infestans]
MDVNRKRVLELSEQGDWDEVLQLIARNPALAQAQDDFGMLPLHWACTEPSVSLDVISTLVRAFPGACELENLSGMLPLHVAIKAKAPGLLVSALLDVNLQAALAKDSSGHYPWIWPSPTAYRASPSTSSARPRARVASEDDDDIPMLVKTQSMMTSTRSLGRELYTASFTMDPMDSNTISLQLKELLSQLHQLSVDIRVNNTSSTSTTYCSSLSSAFSSTGHLGTEGLASVLWNPSDRFGIVLEPAVKGMGARIKGFSSRSDVLGVESLAEGDVLVNINGTSVANSTFTSIMRFLKHFKGTCKLRFRSAVDATTASKCSTGSTGSNPAAEQDNVMYSKVAEMLETTLKKVSAVEETVRLSSAMSLCM